MCVFVCIYVLSFVGLIISKYIKYKCVIQLSYYECVAIRSLIISYDFNTTPNKKNNEFEFNLIMFRVINMLKL